MASAVKYYCFVENLAEKVHNLGSDALKILLTNAAPNVSTHTLRSDTTELSTSGGYTSGGGAVTVTGSSQTTGTYSLTQSADVVFTAASGTIGPFRYAALYNDTPTSPLDPLIIHWDYASSITLADGETFTVNLAASILTIA
jgi:hypothetical protein